MSSNTRPGENGKDSGETDIVEMKKNLAHMNQRKPDGSLISRDHLLQKPLVAEPAEIPKILNSAGAGCFARPSDYCRMFSYPSLVYNLPFDVLFSLTSNRDHCNAA